MTDQAPKVTQADRELYKFILDAPFATGSRINNMPDDTPELQAIARHRIASTGDDTGIREALAAHCASAIRSGYPRTAAGGTIELPPPLVCLECGCGEEITGSDVDEVRQLWAEHAALAATPSPDASNVSKAIMKEALFKCETCNDECNCHPLNDLALAPGGFATCSECWDFNRTRGQPDWDDLPDYSSKFAVKVDASNADDAVEKWLRDFCDKHGPSGPAWNISALLDAFRASRRSPVSDASMVKRIAQFVRDWNGATKDGNTFLIADEIEGQFISPVSDEVAPGPVGGEIDQHG